MATLAFAKARASSSERLDEHQGLLKAVPGAAGYQLWRARSAKGKFVVVKTTASLAVTDSGLARKATYFYKVRAYCLVDGVRAFGGWSPVVSKRL